MSEDGRPVVLVIEDDELLREVMAEVLTDEGYAVIAVADGAAGIAASEERPPDLILLDMKMPGMDGWAFSRAYRALAAHDAPIIVVTAAVDAAKRSSEVDAAAWVDKPFDVDPFLMTVRRVLEQAPKEGGAEDLGTAGVRGP
ncbi:MAG TPA: response regulator [Candidatus Nanopelagicales bacterium]|nr:response regulator [Candidatus Nanopelagicales bacterium]